ncbi:MAG: hypothetical protein LBB88_00625, partial [Planctomycetaceae bacterium]|nr:hypothetical protein [Planctomycetaceae bacterium]
EDIEFLEKRSPRDLDVVTFYKLSADETQETLIQKNEKIFDKTYLKSTFAVDGYFVMLGFPVDAGEIETITYWYSMWSHRRDGLWKGFVKIDLDPSQDTKAKEIIEKINKEVSNDKSL